MFIWAVLQIPVLIYAYISIRAHNFNTTVNLKIIKHAKFYTLVRALAAFFLLLHSYLELEKGWWFTGLRSIAHLFYSMLVNTFEQEDMNALKLSGRWTVVARCYWGFIVSCSSTLMCMWNVKMIRLAFRGHVFFVVNSIGDKNGNQVSLWIWFFYLNLLSDYRKIICYNY